MPLPCWERHGSAQELQQCGTLHGMFFGVVALQLVQIEEFPLDGRQVSGLPNGQIAA